MKTLLTVFIAILLTAAISVEQVPQIITHQGFLADSTGQPVDSTLPMTVRIYADSISGVLLYTENYDAVSINEGIYTLSIHINSSQFDSDRWLELEVNSATLAPRIRLTSVPFAYRADRAELLSKGDSYVAPGNGGISFTVGSIATRLYPLCRRREHS